MFRMIFNIYSILYIIYRIIRIYTYILHFQGLSRVIKGKSRKARIPMGQKPPFWAQYELSHKSPLHHRIITGCYKPSAKGRFILGFPNQPSFFSQTLWQTEELAWLFNTIQMSSLIKCWSDIVWTIWPCTGNWSTKGSTGSGLPYGTIKIGTLRHGHLPVFPPGLTSWKNLREKVVKVWNHVKSSKGIQIAWPVLDENGWRICRQYVNILHLLLKDFNGALAAFGVTPVQ